VSIFAQTGQVELAFTTAATQKVDMSNLFKTLATRCVRLARERTYARCVVDVFFCGGSLS
jgi:hypothetical protein